MGCTSSSISPEEEDTKINGATKTKSLSKDKKFAAANGHQNGHIKDAERKDTPLQHNKQATDNNANNLNSLSQIPVPKSVAFDVTLDGLSGDGVLGSKKRPRKLQTLEPLSIPKLTAEQLQEKQRLADEKREKLKQKKINVFQKSSRRRRELLEAREFDKQQQSEQEKDVRDSIKQAELKREQQLIEIKDKQRLREERAKRARERVKNMQNPDNDIEVEKDFEFNSSTDDAWQNIPDITYNLDEENDLHKVGQLRPTVNTSTVDSYDAAFSRSRSQDTHRLPSLHDLGNSVHVMSDDFFDS